MIRWLLIALFIYLVIRIIQGPKRSRKPFIRFNFGNSPNGRGTTRTGTGRGKAQLDDIEDAEFEDITDKIKEENDS
jgi:hypothetical protein